MRSSKSRLLGFILAGSLTACFQEYSTIAQIMSIICAIVMTIQTLAARIFALHMRERLA